MSHFTVLVVTKSHQTVEDLMAAYDENLSVPAEDGDVIDVDQLAWQYEAFSRVRDEGGVEEALDDWFGCGGWRERLDGSYVELRTANPRGKWDWWTVGGRWSGQLITRDGKTVDEALLADLDIDAMKAVARAYAQEALDKLDAAVAEHGPLPSWAWMNVPRTSAEFEVGRDAFWAHPTVKAANLGLFGTLGLDQLDWIEDDREGWLETKATVNALGYAILAHTGDWLAEGEMGWFGISDSTRSSTELFAKVATEYLARLDPETVTVTLVDAHV